MPKHCLVDSQNPTRAKCVPFHERIIENNLPTCRITLGSSIIQSNRIFQSDNRLNINFLLNRWIKVEPARRNWNWRSSGGIRVGWWFWVSDKPGLGPVAAPPDFAGVVVFLGPVHAKALDSIRFRFVVSFPLAELAMCVGVVLFETEQRLLLMLLSTALI